MTADQPTSTEAAAVTPAPSGTYADPGYQNDGKKRYPLDTKAHVRAAWAFINQTANQKPYTAAQVKRIKARIKTAAKKFGVTISSESAAADWKLLSETVLPRIVEAYASMNLDNGQGDIRVAGYVSDPTELPDLAAATARAALAGLAALDPDEDGDIDLPGDDDDTGDGEADGICPFCGSDVPAGASFCPGCGQPYTSGETAGETKEKHVNDTQETKASDTAPSTDPAAASETTTADTATPAETTTDDTTTETAGLDVGALGKAIGEAVGAAVAGALKPATSETTTDTSTALSEATTSTPSITETIKAAVAEGLKATKDELREEMVAAYGPRRRGFVRTTETETTKPLHEMTEEEFRAHRTEVLNAVVPGGPQA